jgi:hypothetical protein
MRIRATIVLIGVMVVTGLLAAGVLAAPAAQTVLDWQTVDSGGGHGSSSNYLIDGSIGQPLLGAGGSATYRLGAGYGYGIGDAVPIPPGYNMYLPLVVKQHVP